MSFRSAKGSLYGSKVVVARKRNPSIAYRVRSATAFPIVEPSWQQAWNPDSMYRRQGKRRRLNTSRSRSRSLLINKIRGIVSRNPRIGTKFRRFVRYIRRGKPRRTTARPYRPGGFQWLS